MAPVECDRHDICVGLMNIFPVSPISVAELIVSDKNYCFVLV